MNGSLSQYNNLETDEVFEFPGNISPYYIAKTYALNNSGSVEYNGEKYFCISD